MSDKDKAMQQALEALLSVKNHGWDEDTHTGRALITDLKAALEQQPVQEPTPWRDMVVVSLVREGINKHRARELADHFVNFTLPPPLPVQEQQQVGPVEDMLLRRAVLRSAKIVSDGRFVTKQAALKQPPLPVQEPVACRFCHSEKGCWTWQCYHCGEIDDVQKPAPSQQQAEPVAMRMPKVGDKVICLEDESLGVVVSLTAGGSPDIKFADGSHGTYLLREFAELFGYAEQRQPLTKDEALTLEALKYAASKGDGLRNMKIGRFIIKETLPLPVQEPVAWDKTSASFDEWWDSDRRRDNANPFTTDSFAYWAWEGWQAALAQRPWVGLTEDEKFEMAAAQYGWEDLLIAAEARLKEKNT